jgi:ubiquitin-protein ligase
MFTAGTFSLSLSNLPARSRPDPVTIGPVSEDNFFEWEALINGPIDTPYVSCIWIWQNCLFVD